MNETDTNTAIPVSLAEKARECIEELLVTLQLKPGSLLQERDLAEATGIGRTPVREAVQGLANSGLLRIMPRKGLLVAPVLRSELQQVLEARRVLERLMVVKAAERADTDQRDALRVLASEIESADDEPVAFFRLDRRLNALLQEACGNRYLVQALEPLHSHCRRLWYSYRGQLDLAYARTLHAGLARAVAEGDSAASVRALNGIITTQEHLVKGLDDIS